MVYSVTVILSHVTWLLLYSVAVVLGHVTRILLYSVAVRKLNVVLLRSAFAKQQKEVRPFYGFGQEMAPSSSICLCAMPHASLLSKLP